MIITKIAAKNYKTYKDLDLDLTVNADQPIILIGGQNGGGKTTLFQAIYAALYGLEVKDKDHFKRLVSAATPFHNDVRIELEIDFKGKVLMKDFLYKIKRYCVNFQMFFDICLNYFKENFLFILCRQAQPCLLSYFPHKLDQTRRHFSTVYRSRLITFSPPQLLLFSLQVCGHSYCCKNLSSRD